MDNLFEIDSGIDVFRLHEDDSPDAQTYYYYGASEMDHDLFNKIDTIDPMNQKQIRMSGQVPVFHTGDLVLSVTNPRAALVGERFNGYIHTRNYLKITPSEKLDPKYFVFLVNQDRDVRHMLLGDQNNVVIQKTTTAAVKSLQNLKLPPLGEQKLIGEIYFNQLKLSNLLLKKKKLEELRTFTILRRKNNGSH